MTTSRQWYLTHLDDADYDTSQAIDDLIDDLEAAPEGEHAVVDRAGVTARLAKFAKDVKVDVTNGEAQTVPMFQSLWIEGRRVRAGILKLTYEQTRAVSEASRRRADRNEEDARFWEHNIELYERHLALPDLQAVFDAEGVSYALRDEDTGTDG